MAGTRSLPSRPANVSLRLSILLVLATRVAWSGPLFPNPVFDVAGGPGPLVVADVNRDGIPDLVTANAGSTTGDPGSLSVLVGTGDGRFTALDPVPLPAKPSDMATADLNADGAPDLVVFHADAAFFCIFLGAGDGSFIRSAVINTSYPPAIGAIADFNGDGRPDIAAAGFTGTSLPQGFVSIFLGDGSGGVSPASTVFAGSRPNGIAVADLNEDGRADVVTSDTATTFSTIFLGSGDGGLARAGTLATGENPAGLTLRDFDADGHADLAIGSSETSTFPPFHGFLLFRGRGDGTFDGTPVTRAVTFVRSLSAGDVNLDGATDLVVTSDLVVQVFLGNGDGTFALRSSFQVGAANRRAVVGSFDIDGLPDLAVTAEDSRAVFVVSGRGDGTFGPVPAAPSIPAGTQGLAAADFDGDGRSDLAVTDSSAGGVAVYLGNGDGTLEPRLIQPTDMPPTVLAAADFDNDGRIDLAVTHSSCDPRYPCPGFPVRSVVLILLGQGNGRFKPGEKTLVDFDPVAIVPVDLDRDGILDLVVANGGDFDFNVPGDLSVLMGQGGGRFRAAVALQPGFAPVSLAAGDFNADGLPDVAVADGGNATFGSAGSLSFLPGRGDGTFGGPIVLEEGPAVSVLASDLNRDGRSDLAALANGALRVFLAQAGGTFVQAEPTSPGVYPFHLVAADLTGDGLVDLLVAGRARYVSLFPGHGDGTFGAAERFGFGGVFSVLAADLVAGGPQDLVLDADYNGLFVLSRFPPGFLVQDFTIDFSNPVGRGSATVTWVTVRETDLKGFNLVAIDNQGGRVQENQVLIPCIECVTGLGSTYTFIVPKHRRGKDIFLEAVHLDGSVETLGPATRK